MCKYVNFKIFVVFRTYLIYLLSSFYLPQYFWTVLCLVAQSCPTFCDPMDPMDPHQAPLSMAILQARILEWFAMPSSQDLPNSWMEPRSPALLADSLPAELPGKPYLNIILNLFWNNYRFIGSVKKKKSITEQSQVLFTRFSPMVISYITEILTLVQATVLTQTSPVLNALISVSVCIELCNFITYEWNHTFWNWLFLFTQHHFLVIHPSSCTYQ